MEMMSSMGHLSLIKRRPRNEQCIVSAERETDRQRGRERARKRGCYFRPGVVMETAASLQMETSRKHMDRQTNGMRKAQHDATPRPCDSVHHPHWHPRLQSDDSGVLFITQNEYQWESVGFFFFTLGSNEEEGEKYSESRAA